MIQMHQLATGTPGLAPLVLLHAFPFSSEMWKSMVASLVKYRPELPILSVDLPGFGKAPEVESWTMKDAAKAIFDEIKSRGHQQVILTGLSMGGYLAYQCYKDYPDCISALILADSKASADNDKAKADREQFAKLVLEKGSTVSMQTMHAKMLAPDTYNSDPALADTVKQWMLSASPEGTAAALRAMADRPDSKELLPLINIPTLIIRGEHDQVTPKEEMRGMHEATRGSRYVEIKNAGHLSAVEQPDEFADVVAQFVETLG